MSRMQIGILAGVIATFVALVLFWETLWPLLILGGVAGVLYIIGTKTDLLANIVTKKSEEEQSEETNIEDAAWDKSGFTQRSLLLIFAIGTTIWLLLLAFTEPVLNAEGEVTFSWARLWFWAVIAYAVLSYRFWAPVPIGFQAALTLFGKPIANVEAGAPYAPLFVIQVNQVTAQVKQREFPAEPENIYRGEMKSEDELPAGKRPPVRIQFRDSISEDRAQQLFGDDFSVSGVSGETIDFVTDVPVDGLASRVTAEVQHVVRIRVNNPSQFLTNIGDIEEAFKQIEDEMVSVLYRYYSRMSVGQALMNIRWMSIHLFRAVERRVGARADIRSWGVDVQAAFVKMIHTDHGINIAISEAAQAPFEKSKTIIDAEGERQKRELEGKGAAVAARELEKRTLEGRAAGLKKLAFEIEVSGGEAQSAEVARAIGEGGNTIVVGAEGFSQLAGVAAAALGKPKNQSDSGIRRSNRQNEETGDRSDAPEEGGNS